MRSKKRNTIILSVFLFLLVVANCQSHTFLAREEHAFFESSGTNNILYAQQVSTIHILKVDKSGSIDKTEKTLPLDKKQEMMRTLINTEYSNLTPKEMFEEKLCILKEYALVSPDTTLEEIFDDNMTGKFNEKSFNITEMESFGAAFAPIFLAGMGFGAGFGFRHLPVIRRMAGNIFSVGVIGLGAVLCYDVYTNTLYVQFTFTFPLLLHILAGFIGIMLFAFDSVFPPIPGTPPVTIYSNFVGLGFAGLAVGLLLSV